MTSQGTVTPPAPRGLSALGAMAVCARAELRGPRALASAAAASRLVPAPWGPVWRHLRPHDLKVRPRVHAPHGDVHGSASADTCRGGSPRSPAEPGAPKTQAREKPGAPEGPPPRLGSHRVQTRVPAARSREGGGSAAQQRTRGTRPAPGKGRFRGPAAGTGCV